MKMWHRFHIPVAIEAHQPQASGQQVLFDLLDGISTRNLNSLRYKY